MSYKQPDRTEEFRTIGGIKALVNTDPGEIFIDLPASNPRYIRVQEDGRIQEGDVSSRSPAEMAGPLLTHWTIKSITEETVTGIDDKTGEVKEWDRQHLVRGLSTGEFSAELSTFDRVSVAQIEAGSASSAIEDPKEGGLTVIVIVYGNNGEKFTQTYVGPEADLESLELVEQDVRIKQFDEEVRQHFDGAVRRALEVEQRFR